MTDKERILLALVSDIYRTALYGSRDKIDNWRKIQPSIYDESTALKKGDLVVASTTITPNEFCVGFIENIFGDYVLIREIGSKRVCKYYNERFYVIDKKLIGNEILEGVQYQIYQKVLKAFQSSVYSYTYRFGGISFADNICIVEGRKVFSDDRVFKIEFAYNSKTTIKSITNLIDTETLKLKESEDTE